MVSNKKAAIVVAISVAFSGFAFGAEKGLIGIALPNKTEARWVMDGKNIVAALEQKGYKTDLQYSQYDVPTQISQIENLITKGAKVLVVAPVDGKTLSSTLKNAKQKGIKVVSYDKLITDTPDVDYYATFDNFQVGVLQGSAIVDTLKLKTAKGPFNFEVFGGSLDDNNAHVVYKGGMSVLKPFIDSGKLVVKSKQTELSKVATFKWDGATAQARMDNILSAFYGNAKVEAVWTPNDNIANGVISSLKGVGYGAGNLPMPVITGQDAQLINIKAIIRGDQTATVFKDTRKLSKAAADIVDAIMTGKTVPVNDAKSYNNGRKLVPTFLVKPELVTKANWKPVLVDGDGFYKASQLN